MGNSYTVFVNDSSIIYEGNWILNPTMIVAQSPSSSKSESSPESTSVPSGSGGGGNSNSTKGNTESDNSLVTRGSSGSSGGPFVLSAQSTFDPTASVYFEFMGSAISVVGFIRNGSNPVSANYTIDGKIPLMREETGLTLSGGIDGIGHQTLFSSPKLGEGYHSISIDAINATQDRPYTITSFAVSSGPKPTHKKNTGAIVGGVLGGIILLLLVLLGIFYAWRRRRVGQYTRRVYPPMMQYVQPMYQGPISPETYISRVTSGPVDTDSKFAFDARYEVARREPSWVSLDVPSGALVRDRSASPLSQHKNSSMQAERSHFSEFTAASLSQMAFREPTPVPQIPLRVVSPGTKSNGSIGGFPKARALY